MANEKRLIDGNLLCDGCSFKTHSGECLMPCCKARTLPTVDAVEVVHGRWKKAHIAGYLKCNCCEDAFIYEEWLKSGKWSYCPNCGAKMDSDLSSDEKR